MSTSRKKKQKIQAKSLIAILLPTLGALLLLVLILSFGNFTATRPEETTTAPNTPEDNPYS